MLRPLFGLLLAAIALAPAASAQTRWLQTVQVIAPVDEYRVTGALLDSLVHAAERGGVTVKREPEDAARSFRALEDDLLREGYDFSSANRVFISYRLEATQRGFVSEIQDLHFIYRPEGYEDIDVPILYLDAREAPVRRVLVSGGTRQLQNQAAFEPFYDQLLFHQLADASVVSVGGRVVRDPQEARAEKERLLATIRRFLY